MSNKSPGMRLQAGLEAAPDLILCVPYLETSSTKGSMNFLNSSLRVELQEVSVRSSSLDYIKHSKKIKFNLYLSLQHWK